VTLALHSSSPDDTRAIAAALAPLVRPRDLIVLAGEMGAGKTAFAQGLALGLGVDDPVTSPTFTLVRTYEGRLPVHHVDVYRLERLVEVHDLGLSELLDGDGAVVIEWGDVVTAALPVDYVEVYMSFAVSENERSLVLRPVGHAWSTRFRLVEDALAAWRC
jgi:tRNA threonylcarbamoyladenosine biosynthesis protein TsaE